MRKNRIKHARTQHSLSTSSQQTSKSDAWADSRYFDNLKVVSTLYATTRLADADEDNQQADSWQPQPHLGYTLLDTFHDPFIGGGQGLTERQLSLHHVCEFCDYMDKSSTDKLKDMHSLAPALMANPTTRSPYSPAVYMTHLCLKYSPAAALLTSILAEEMIHKILGLPKTTNMTAQKLQGNRALKSALVNFRIDFQAAYLALIKAAQVSLFVGDAEALHTQYLAAEMAIEAVGGLKNALALTPAVEPFYVSSFPFYRAPVATAKALKHVTSRFLSSLQQILHQDISRHRRSFHCRISDLLEDSRTADDHLKLEQDIVTSLRPYITPAANSSTTSLKSVLILLLELCWTFVVLHQEQEVRLETLRYIKLLLDICCRSRPDVQADDTTPRTYAAMVAHARRERSNKQTPNKRLEYDSFITQMEIDGYKIFEYPVNPGRATIVAKLYAWLIDDPVNGTAFTANELETLRTQILYAWVQQHTDQL